MPKRRLGSLLGWESSLRGRTSVECDRGQAFRAPAA